MGFTGRKKDKRDLTGRVITLALLFVVLVFAVIYIVSLNFSLGWFSKDAKVSGRNMSIAAYGDQYDILVERSTEFDGILNGLPKYEDVSDFKSQLAAEPNGYSFTASSTSEASGLAYELVNEASYSENGEDYHFLMPGSYGTLTFYLKPKVEGDIIANFVVSTGCYKKVIDNGNITFNKIQEPGVRNLLKGHILFFKERTGNQPENYKYNGLISSGTFNYNTAEHTKCTKPGKTDCYEITLFWEWPLTYRDIIGNISETAGQRKYPSELATFINQNREYFFAINQMSNDVEYLNDGYNDGDQTIGEQANFIAAFVAID